MVASLADFLPLEVASTDQGWGKGCSAVILRAVVERTANGQSVGEIADELGVTRRTVCRLRARCREEGLLDVVRRPGAVAGLLGQ